MSNSEQSGGFALLVAMAILAGHLTHGMLTDTLRDQMDVEHASGQLPKFTLTGRDENGRQTLDYGEGYE